MIVHMTQGTIWHVIAGIIPSTPAYIYNMVYKSSESPAVYATAGAKWR